MRKLIFIGLLLLGGWSRGESGDDAIPRIPVVHTWGDLLKSKPISVESERVLFPDPDPNGKGQKARVSVWVGIDRNHTTGYGGAVLYCLAKGVSFGRTQHGDLGPFYVGVRAPKGELVNMESLRDGLLPSHDSSYLLFTESIPFGRSGKYNVELFMPGKTDLEVRRHIYAKIEVTASGEAVLPWSPWSASKNEETRWSSHDGNILGMTKTYTSMTVSNPVGRVAIPGAVRVFVQGKIPSLDTSLPQLTTDAPDAGTHLKLEDNNLTVTVQQPLEVYFPDDHFLTRWWVNDKPSVPDPKAEDSEAPKFRALGARLWFVKEVHFEIDFRPKRLNVKKGDKIGVQILYCPDGWQGCGAHTWLDTGPSQPGGSITSIPPAFSYPSNRIDFIYSGDPEHFQQK